MAEGRAAALGGRCGPGASGPVGLRSQTRRVWIGNLPLFAGVKVKTSCQDACRRAYHQGGEQALPGAQGENPPPFVGNVLPCPSLSLSRSCHRGAAGVEMSQSMIMTALTWTFVLTVAAFNLQRDMGAKNFELYCQTVKAKEWKKKASSPHHSANHPSPTFPPSRRQQTHLRNHSPMP